MSKWIEICLSDLGRIVTGKTPPTGEQSYYNGNIPFVSPKDLSIDSRYISSTITTISEKALAKFRNQVLPPNTVMFTALSYGFGKIGLASRFCISNQQINSIIVNEHEHDFDFVYYLLRHYKDYIFSFNSGIVTPIIPKSTFGKIKVRIPANKQAEISISRILSAYDDLIENNLQRIRLLEELAQRTYEEWFVKFRVKGEVLPIDPETGLPEGWVIMRLHEVSKINSKNLSKNPGHPIRYVDISSVSTNRIETIEELSFDNAPGRARRIVKHGDIIWSCVRPNRKSYALIWNPIPNLIVSTGFAVITPSTLPTSYLFEFLSSDTFVGHLSSLATGAAYPAVTARVFEDAPVPCPPKELILDFDKFWEPIAELCSNLQTQNRLLKEARDILLPRLMNGEIEV